VLEARLECRLGAFDLVLALEVPERETLVLVGESGSGKSTLLRLLAGLRRPDSGRIALNNEVWFDSTVGTHVPPQARQVGWVPQDYALLPHLNVFENVAFGLRARGGRSRDVEPRTRQTLERLEILDLADRRPSQLSGGQQQRVALARALVSEPSLLLLDEPLAALDLQTRAVVRAELRAILATLSCVTVLVTHSPLEAVVFGRRIAVLEGGRVVQEGAPETLLRQPRSPYVAAFMGLNLFHGHSQMPKSSGLTEIRTADGSVLGSGVEGNQDLFLVVSPREITLFREAPPAGSAQNVYRGRVLEVIPEPPLGERVRVVLGTHPPLVAEITRAAVDQLGLIEGGEVYATFKATAVNAYR
jgi:molybdate transport system ATP-binding protein